MITFWIRTTQSHWPTKRWLTVRARRPTSLPNQALSVNTSPKVSRTLRKWKLTVFFLFTTDSAKTKSTLDLVSNSGHHHDFKQSEPNLYSAVSERNLNTKPEDQIVKSEPYRYHMPDYGQVSCYETWVFVIYINPFRIKISLWRLMSQLFTSQQTFAICHSSTTMATISFSGKLLRFTPICQQSLIINLYSANFGLSKLPLFETNLWNFF